MGKLVAGGSEERMTGLTGQKSPPEQDTVWYVYLGGLGAGGGGAIGQLHR